MGGEVRKASSGPSFTKDNPHYLGFSSNRQVARLLKQKIVLIREGPLIQDHFSIFGKFHPRCLQTLKFTGSKVIDMQAPIECRWTDIQRRRRVNARFAVSGEPGSRRRRPTREHGTTESLTL